MKTREITPGCYKQELPPKILQILSRPFQALKTSLDEQWLRNISLPLINLSALRFQMAVNQWYSFM